MQYLIDIQTILSHRKHFVIKVLWRRKSSITL